jgi:ribosomal protein L7Ae-like RNA K-turn-binding protein
MVDEKDAMDITSERVIKTVEKLRKEYKVSIYFVL